MKNSIVLSVQKNPLLELARLRRDKRKNIHVSIGNKKVVTGTFDPYRSNLTTLDHLLSGVAENILNYVYGSLDKPQLRRMAKFFINAGLREKFLVIQK